MGFFSSAKKALGGVASAALGGGLEGLGGSMGATAPKPYTQHLKKGIQWKVADAKAAGIHPLFALGASVGSPIMQASGQDATGSAIGGALEGIAGQMAKPGKQPITPMEMAATRAQMASASRDEAEAMLINSQRKRLEQEAIPTGVGRLPGPAVIPGQAATDPGAVLEKVPQMASKPGDPSAAAGNHPAFREVVYGTDAAGKPKKVWIANTEEIPEAGENVAAIIAAAMKNMGWLDDSPPPTPPPGKVLTRRGYRQRR